MAASLTRRPDSSLEGWEPEEIPAEWLAILRDIPGYDPLAHAKDCRFSERLANKALQFFPECLTHIEGDLAGKPFQLEHWQQAVIANLFGWVRLDGKGRQVRRYRELFLEVPRKGGKTPLVAGIGLFVLFCDDERGQQGYIAAGDREQAGMLFRHCKGMVEHEPMMRERCSVYGGTAQAGQSRSIVKHDGSFLRVIAADGDTQHGGNSHLVIVDELHVQPNRDLVDVLATSMASENRKQPLFVSITTAGYDRHSICYEKYQRACAVRDNGGDPMRPGYDPSFLPVVYEALPEDDWKSEETWKKANPNLGVSVSLDYLRRACQTAVEIPAMETTFRQLHLNQWTEKSNRWLPMQAWHAWPKDRQMPSFEGRVGYAGLDLASVSDTTAFVVIFEMDGGGYWVIPKFWVPRAAVEARTRKQSAPYSEWEKAGFLTVTEGDWCDYEVVERDIVAMRGEYYIEQVGYDPKEASMLSQRLINAGLDMRPITQNPGSYNEPAKMLETFVVGRQLGHCHHPVLSWMAGNVVLSPRHLQNGLRMPDKAGSADKIDGIAALLMAMHVAIANPSFKSIYSSGGNLSL